MQNLMLSKIVGLAASVCFVGAWTAFAADKDDFEKFREQAEARKKETINKLMKDQAPAIVTIEFIAKESIMGQEQKNEMEATGVMVSADGLVLTANSRLQGMMSMAMKMAGGMMGGMMGGMPPIQSDTENLRVVVGNETVEYEAKLVARDSDLDLAWVRIVDPKDRKYSYLDFNDAAKLEIGDSYYTISRMAKRFDRVPTVGSSTISAAIENPRPLLVGAGSFGSPVFDSNGKVAGFIITQPPEEGESEAVSLDGLMTMGNGFILPAPKLVEALKQAKDAKPTEGK